MTTLDELPAATVPRCFPLRVEEPPQTWSPPGVAFVLARLSFGCLSLLFLFLPQGFLATEQDKAIDAVGWRISWLAGWPRQITGDGL